VVNKKAQGSVLVRVFTALAYILALLFVLIVLNLSGCNAGNEIEKTIQNNHKDVVNLRAAEQLSSLLRTDIPDIEALTERIESLRDKEGLIFDEGFQTRFVTEVVNLNYDSIEYTLEFLEQHPEVYLDKTYAQFISAIYAYENTESVFDIVTKAMFIRKLYSESAYESEKKKGFTLHIVGDLSEDERLALYITPEISVREGMHKKYETEKKDVVSFIGSISEPSEEDEKPGIAYQILPTQDQQGVTVKFQIRQEGESLPTI
jgi:hypothetical protein